MFELMVAILGFLFGVVLIAYSSDKAVEHSLKIASAWRISPILVGLILVSIGTDLPEIMNSIISSSIGHGDINVGDSLGSAFTQVTLILGIIALLVRGFQVNKKEIAVIGVCEILAVVLAILAVEDGHISSINGLLLLVSWFVLMFISLCETERYYVSEVLPEKRFHHFLMALISFAGVAVSSYVLIQSIMALSRVFSISEFYVSFFVAAIGTSLPELAVDLNAVRRREYRLALGDIIGSSIVDASLSIGIGPLFFPTAVSGGPALTTGLYTLAASFLVVVTLALRGKVDRKVGLLFIFVYLLSYVLLQ